MGISMFVDLKGEYDVGILENPFIAVAAITRIHLCVRGDIPYDSEIKSTAQQLVDDGDRMIFVQCLANGNLEMADDVVKEAKIHYDVWASTQVSP